MNHPTTEQRELLELAAKAAGIGPLDFDYAMREGHGFYFGPRLPMPQGVLMAATHTYWTPLTDDGDALRLAVKLNFLIDVDRNSTEAGGFGTHGFHAEPHGSDPYAATRRAIVRAAAAIAKGEKA